MRHGMICSFLVFLLLSAFYIDFAQAQDVPDLIDRRIRITQHNIRSLQDIDPDRQAVLERDLQTMVRWKARWNQQAQAASPALAPEQLPVEGECPEECVQSDF